MSAAEQIEATTERKWLHLAAQRHGHRPLAVKRRPPNFMWRCGMSKPNPRRTNGTLRDKIRKRVLREEDTCWLCGKPVDKTLHHHDPQAPEVDEVVPVSKGGSPYDRTNCRLSHRICNQKRGNGDRGWSPEKDLPAPLKTSRKW